MTSRRFLATVLSASSILLAACDNRRSEPDEPDLKSASWRRDVETRAQTQSAAIREMAAKVLDERMSGAGYPTPVSDWIARISTDDAKQVANALVTMKETDWEPVPTEVIVGLVVPLLSDRRGYTVHFPPEPGGFDSHTISRSVSQSAAEALGPRTTGNSIVVPGLATFVLCRENPHCATVAISMQRMVAATKTEEDAKTAATALVEIELAEPWVADRYPWESSDFLQSNGACDLRGHARRLLTELHARFPVVYYDHGGD